MENRGRGQKSDLSHGPQTQSVGFKKDRKTSMFQKESYAQILRERLRESIHDVQYVEPPFDDSIADIGKEWKSALSKLKFANSYRMEPLKKFQAHSVETKVQQILKPAEALPASVLDSEVAEFFQLSNFLMKDKFLRKELCAVYERTEESLKDVKYDDRGLSQLSLQLADQILLAVKEFGYHRYKFIIKVLFIQKTGQAINVASRWIWDVAWDNWVEAKHETESYVALALVFAVYCE